MIVLCCWLLSGCLDWLYLLYYVVIVCVVVSVLCTIVCILDCIIVRLIVSMIVSVVIDCSIFFVCCLYVVVLLSWIVHIVVDCQRCMRDCQNCIMFVWSPQLYGFVLVMKQRIVLETIRPPHQQSCRIIMSRRRLYNPQWLPTELRIVVRARARSYNPQRTIKNKRPKRRSHSPATAYVLTTPLSRRGDQLYQMHLQPSRSSPGYIKPPPTCNCTW